MNRLFPIIMLIMMVSSCISHRPVEDFRRRVHVNTFSDSIVQVPLLIVTDSGLCEVLDTVIEFNSACISHVMGADTWIEISIKNIGDDTIALYVDAFQFSGKFNANDVYFLIDSGYYGVFYYQDYLVAVRNWSHKLGYVFHKTDSMAKILMLRSNIVIYQYRSYYNLYFDEHSLIYYYHVNGQYVPWLKQRMCSEYYPIYHKIRRWDSMRKLAEKYKVTQEQIMRLNQLHAPILPAKGTIKIQ